MKALLLSAALLALCAAAVIASTQDITIRARAGTVSYDRADGSGMSQLPLGRTAALNPGGVVRTGAEGSLAEVVLPDSSVIVMGSDTSLKVKRAEWNQETGGVAMIELQSGKIRFSIEHVNGTRANYTFQTPIAQVVARGTVGDIAFDSGDGLHVHTSSGGTGLEVIGPDGAHVVVRSQTLWMRYVSGKLVTTMSEPVK